MRGDAWEAIDRVSPKPLILLLNVPIWLALGPPAWPMGPKPPGGGKSPAPGPASPGKMGPKPALGLAIRAVVFGRGTLDEADAGEDGFRSGVERGAALDGLAAKNIGRTTAALTERRSPIREVRLASADLLKPPEPARNSMARRPTNTPG